MHDSTIFSLEDIPKDKLLENSRKWDKPTSVEFKRMLDEIESANEIDLSLIKGGSNNFIISGKHTATGLPIVGNDPHLKNYIPCLWYIANIYVEEGDFKVHGVFIPGMPTMLLGTNGYVVTALTAGHIDLATVFQVEKAAGGMVLDGKVVKYTKRTERIYMNVSKTKYIDHDFYDTPYGPVLNDGYKALLKITEHRMVDLNFDKHDYVFQCALLNQESKVMEGSTRGFICKDLYCIKSYIELMDASVNLIIGDVLA